MNIKSFRKETSERSELQNWVLDELSASSFFYFSGFEGCNENSSNQVTAVLDRVSIEIDDLPDNPLPLEQVKKTIEVLEGRSLPGKISFCECLGFPYTYILYNYEYGFVLRYELTKDRIELIEKYPSFAAFSQWIQTIKQWTSSKEYRELPDLPEFDKALRKAGCPWPTNIDCVAFSNNNNPIALIEFQNAKKTKVESHYNNAFFLPIWDSSHNCYKSGPDEQRWRSQEILRVQSGLPHLTIVWSQKQDILIVKQLERVTFPDYSERDKIIDYRTELGKFNASVNRLSQIKNNAFYGSIRRKFRSLSLTNMNGRVNVCTNESPLSIDNKTFPFLYGHRYKALQKGQVLTFIDSLLASLQQDSDTL